MSVLVIGMEMPASCASCVLRFGMRCEAVTPRREIRFKSIYDLGRMDYCPLIEVPVPHGRLIDADELMKNLKTMRAGAQVNVAPTIIEAEE